MIIMIAEFPEIISFKISKREKEQIEDLIFKGKFENKSVFVRSAIKELLQKISSNTQGLNGLMDEPGLT